MFYHKDLDSEPLPLHGYDSVPLARPGENSAPKEMFTGFVKVFDLGEAEQLTAYNQVVEAVAKGISTICREEVNYDAKKGRYVVFVRWIQRGLVNASQMYAKASINDEQQVIFNRR